MTLSRSTRVNLLIGTGHFLSHFYVLCLPPMFIVWQVAFGVNFATLGLAVALMSGTTALLQRRWVFWWTAMAPRHFWWAARC